MYGALVNIDEEVVNNHLVLRFEGDLDTNISPRVEVHINEAFNKGIKSIVINFKKLDYISSAGLRVLLIAAKRAKRENGSLRVCELNGDVQDIFEISGFDDLLDLYESEEKALSA